MTYIRLANQTLSTPPPAPDPIILPGSITKIIYSETYPISIPLATIVIYKGTMFRGLRMLESDFLNDLTPVPVKGYFEFFAAVSLTPNYMTPIMNDFPFDFQINFVSDGWYILSKAGNTGIIPLPGVANHSLNLSFHSVDTPHSFGWQDINGGHDTGKIQITVMKNDTTGNTRVNAPFHLRFCAYYTFNALTP